MIFSYIKVINLILFNLYQFTNFLTLPNNFFLQVTSVEDGQKLQSINNPDKKNKGQYENHFMSFVIFNLAINHAK